MRVIAGSAGSLKLRTIEGTHTRPTTDRIKETLFNMISPGLLDCTFLDLFAGSGGIGIEALSRGAKKAVFVENDPRAARCIRENLEFTKLSGRAQVMRSDVFSALQELEGKQVFDYVFMDPPYGKDLEKQTLIRLSPSGLADANTKIIVEASLETDFSYLRGLGFSVVREKRYKTNMHVFIRRTGEGKSC